MCALADVANSKEIGSDVEKAQDVSGEAIASKNFGKSYAVGGWGREVVKPSTKPQAAALDGAETEEVVEPIPKVPVTV